MVGHLRIHRKETGEPVLEAKIHSRNNRLHCPHCPCTFTHRMGLFSHMRIHDSGIHHNADNTETPCTPTALAILRAPATPTTMNDILPASSDFSCPHCARNFNSRIGLVCHLRIHRTEAGKLVPGASTYSRRARYYCPHCYRTFTHRVGLLEHRHLHENLRLIKVWWHAQGWLRPRQPPVPSPISGLLDSVFTPDSGGGGGESAVAAAQGYYHLKLIHAQVTVPAPPGVEHAVDLVEIDGRTAIWRGQN
ncbi:unnamed protein product [Schistocephalus solidus]|uniref:C2H2-type domain-containing protein n=1 Tax=Schistocephalus solidus TaxID=70667 RepID=A0A3P7DIT0_SCHSO|nr:unnamed protein product [Schistocephalus solidus]